MYKSTTPIIDGIVVPIVHDDGGRWVEHDGLVVQGRDAWLYALCRQVVRRNASEAAGRSGLRRLSAVIEREFRFRTADDAEWSDDKLRGEIKSKLSRLGGMLTTGELKPWDGSRRENPAIVPSIQQPDTTFAWLRKRRAALDVLMTAAAPGAIEARALQTDRTAAAAAVSAGIHAALNAFFDDVELGLNHLHLLKSATGSGKTSRAIEEIARNPRTRAWDGREGGPGPFVFLTPTYRNLAELRAHAAILNLNPDASDDALTAEAAERGILTEEEARKEIKRLRRLAAGAGLRTMVYSGKVEAGCKRESEVTALMEAAVSTSSLCKVTIMRGDVREERTCRFYARCKAIAQRHDVARMHIVFMPRHFLDLEIPDELKKVRGVVADETIFGLLLHKLVFPIATFGETRPLPKLTRKEDETGVDPRLMLALRERAVDIVWEAMERGDDPAAAIDKAGAVKAAEAAKRVCEDAMTGATRPHPDMIRAELDNVIKHSNESVGAKGELQFWTLVLERIELLNAGKATGARDNRIQLQDGNTDAPNVRLAWASEANWSDAPLLLLDASGDEEITRRLFPDREIVVHDVPIDLNIRLLACIDRRFAMHSLLPPKDAPASVKLAAAKMIAEIRQVISMICGVHSDGRVLIGMPKALRRVVQRKWAPPTNADFLHSGAEAGLDFARQHVAVVSIGRLELPVSEIDAQVAALTYRDANPEAPIDTYGTGLDGDGKAIYPNIVKRVLQLRDGSDAAYDTAEHAGPIARRVQAQYREERIRQLVGRIRPVYREDTPAAYIIGQAIPSGFIVDELCGWRDLVESGASFWDAARLAGVLSGTAMAAADPHTATAAQYGAWIATVPAEILERYTSVEVDLDRTGVVTIAIPGHAERPAQHAGACLTALGLHGTFVKPSLQLGKRAAPAPEGRPDDAIEDALGSIADRWIEETAAVEAVRQFVSRRGEWRPAKGSYRAGTGDLDMSKASLQAWAILAILDDPWVQTGESGDTAAPAKRAVA